MAIETLYLTQHDLQPYYYVTVKDSSGALVDLTGAVIRANMKLVGGTAPKINRSSTGIVIANQTTNKGEFEYRWQAGDTDTAGTYYIEFEVTPQTGGKFTLPGGAQGATQVIIEAGLDGE